MAQEPSIHVIVSMLMMQMKKIPIFAHAWWQPLLNAAI